MAGSDEINLIVHPLGIDAQGVSFVNPTGMAADYNVGGIEFLSGANPEFPYRRQLAKVRKDQFDASGNPGDNSLEGWWSRTQTDWSLGAGQEYMEPITVDGVDRMFWSSAGVDVFSSLGNVSLLPAASFHSSFSASTTPHIATFTGGFIVSSGTTVKRIVGNTVDTVTAAGAVESIVVAGPNVLVLSSGKIEWAPLSGSFTLTTGFTFTGSARAWWIKSRTLIALGSELHENAGGTITGSTDLDAATPLYDLQDSSMRVVGAASTPTAILIACTSDSGSIIQSITVADDGTLPSSTQPRIVAEFPGNERLYDIATYLGTYIAIASDQGVRIGTLSSSGGLTYGPLLDSPVPGVTSNVFNAYDRFMHYPVADAGDSRSGLVRVDLSELGDDGRAAWSTFLRVDAGEGTVYDARVDGLRSGYLFSGDGSANTLWYFPDGGPLDTGWLRTSKVRYGTLELKQYDSVRVNTESGHDGSITVSIIDSDGVSNRRAGTSEDFPQITLKTNLKNAHSEISLYMEFARSDTDPTDGPVLKSWLMKALPAVENRGEEILLPLLNFDFEHDQHGVTFGYEGRAWARWQALVERLSDGSALLVREYNSNAAYLAVTLDCSFSQSAPPNNASGFGGIINLVLKSA